MNDGFINSNFHYAHTFTDDNDGDAVFSHTDHVIDVLAKVFEWIEDDEEADSLLHEHMLDSIYFTLDSADAGNDPRVIITSSIFHCNNSKSIVTL